MIIDLDITRGFEIRHSDQFDSEIEAAMGRGFVPSPFPSTDPGDVLAYNPFAAIIAALNI